MALMQTLWETTNKKYEVWSGLGLSVIGCVSLVQMTGLPKLLCLFQSFLILKINSLIFKEEYIFKNVKNLGLMKSGMFYPFYY